MRLPVRVYRRVAALAILVALAAMPVLAVVWVLEDYWSNAAEIDAERDAIARFEAIARFAPRLEAYRAKAPDLAHFPWLLPGSDQALAAASLQARLKELAQANGVAVAQARDLEPRAKGALTYVGVGLDMSGRADAMVPLLRAIEADVPLLMIEKAAFRAEPGSDPRYDPTLLYVGLEVWSALKGPRQLENGS
jgi:hypothetical protein